MRGAAGCRTRAWERGCDPERDSGRHGEARRAIVMSDDRYRFVHSAPNENRPSRPETNLASFRTRARVGRLARIWSVESCPTTLATMTALSSAAPTPSPGATFHLAIPVRDIAEARAFYGDTLGFRKGRESKTWTDYDVFGVCQLVVHEVAGFDAARQHSAVDGDPVPVPHFGAALSAVDFDALVDRLQKKNIAFATSPHARFVGQPGEQRTFFFLDPSGNALEFKTMKHPGNLFARYDVDAFEEP